MTNRLERKSKDGHIYINYRNHRDENNNNNLSCSYGSNHFFFIFGPKQGVFKIRIRLLGPVKCGFTFRGLQNAYPDPVYTKHGSARLSWESYTLSSSYCIIHIEPQIPTGTLMKPDLKPEERKLQSVPYIKANIYTANQATFPIQIYAITV